MAERRNRFDNAPNGNVDLKELTMSISGMSKNKGRTATLKTDKQVEDISIDLIDEYDKNETLFGYNNLDDVIDSIKKTGTQGVTINVFVKGDGRYLCYSGNTRLKAMKALGEKKITCIIEGLVPDEHELMLRAIHNNTQREFDPYHIAQEIELVEESLRKKGLIGSDLTDEIESITGFKLTAQKMYKQIRKLEPSLQQLFNSKGIPYQHLLKVCKQIPADKIDDFIKTYHQEIPNGEATGELIDSVYSMVALRPSRVTSRPSTCYQLGSEFKPIFHMTRGDDGSYYVPKNKREECLKQISLLEEELNKIKAVCKE